MWSQIIRNQNIVGPFQHNLFTKPGLSDFFFVAAQLRIVACPVKYNVTKHPQVYLQGKMHYAGTVTIPHFPDQNAPKAWQTPRLRIVRMSLAIQYDALESLIPKMENDWNKIEIRRSDIFFFYLKGSILIRKPILFNGVHQRLITAKECPKRFHCIVYFLIQAA